MKGATIRLVSQIHIRMTKALHDGGAKIILGTDTELNIVLFSAEGGDEKAWKKTVFLNRR